MRKWVSSPAYDLAVRLLVEARAASGLTQRAVEERLGLEYHGYIAKIERKQRQMNVVEFVAILRALGADEAAALRQLLSQLPEKIEV